MKELIIKTINNKIKASENQFFRTPLVGFADARDDIFLQFKSLIGNNHYVPQDLLPEARTVAAFFLPYKKDLVTLNQNGRDAERSWAEAYQYTNNLINEICQELCNQLSQSGAKMAWLLPTYEFDRNNLLAQWSHKHVAFACGLGNFGLNQLLITAKGCAGRFGTLVLDAKLEPSPRPSETHRCFSETGCTYCINKCPEQALSLSGFNRHKCYSRCLANDALYPDLDSVEVCGKCAVGPCAYIE